MITILSIIFSFALFAAEYPETGFDKKFFEKNTPRELLEQRKTSTDKEMEKCRVDYKAAIAKFHTEQTLFFKYLDEKKDADTLQAQEAETRRAKEAAQVFLVKCGECWNENTVQTGGRYKADGSCQLKDTDSKSLEEKYQKLTDSMKGVKKYARKYDFKEGFYYMLELAHADQKKGIIDYDVKQVDEKDPLSVLMVPRALFNTCFPFLLTGGYSRAKFAEKEFFLLQGEATAPTGELKKNWPKSYEDLKPGGGSVTFTPFDISVKKANVQWQVSADGYLRYYVDVDFGQPIPLIKKMSELIIRDTLMTLYERAEPLGW